MKKLILTIITLCLLTLFAYADNSENCVVYDFTATNSEDSADMLGFKVKDGFHVSVLNGKLSTISTFGIPVTFVLEDEKICNYDYAVFALQCGYIDENSILTMKYTDADGNVTQADYEIPSKKFNLYSVKLPDTKTVKLEIFVNSVQPDMDMYSVDLDYLRLYKSDEFTLLTIDSTRAFDDGEVKALDCPALIKNDFTLTPARFVAESFGADVQWFGDERKVVITKGETVIELIIDNPVAKVNGEEITLDVAPCIINDFTYTPARFVAENLGALVEWDPHYRTVLLSL